MPEVAMMKVRVRNGIMLSCGRLPPLGVIAAGANDVLAGPGLKRLSAAPELAQTPLAGLSCVPTAEDALTVWV